MTHYMDCFSPENYRESDFICSGTYRLWNEEGSDFSVKPFRVEVSVEEGSGIELLEIAVAEELSILSEDLINVNYK
jgi:catalase